MKYEIHVPIYNAVVWLVITNDINSEHNLMEKWFGTLQETERFLALCSYGRGQNFALFFKPSALTLNVVSHEIFHLTHRILDWSGVPFDKFTHEAAALLHGYLCATIFPYLFKPFECEM